MVSTYDSAGNAKPTAGDAPNDFMGGALRGIDTSITLSYGDNDPNNSWGVDQRGRLWLRSSSPGSHVSPRLRLFQQTAAAGPSHGWRDLRLRKEIHATQAWPVVFTTTSPRAADVPWEDVSLATLLDSLQDSGQAECLVSEAKLLVRITPAATETLADAAKGYIAFRQNGATHDGKRVYAQVSGRPIEVEIDVPLDSTEKCEFTLVVGDGTPNCAYSAWLVALKEMV